MKSIIIFFLALNGREMTDQHGNKLTVTVGDGHNVVQFKSITSVYVASDCRFFVRGGAMTAAKRTGKTFVTVDKTGIWLPSIQ